jgi:hypothetical protein
MGNPFTSLVSYDLDADPVLFGKVAPTVLGICLAPVDSVDRVYKDQENDTTSATILSRIVGSGGSYTLDLDSGSTPAVWTPSGQRYRNIVRFSSPEFSLDKDGKVPDVSWEVVGRAVTGTTDCLPKDIAYDIVVTLMGRSSSELQTDTGLDGTAASSWWYWCRAMGFRVSRCLRDQVPAKQLLEELAAATFSTVIVSEGKIKFVPLGDSSVTGDGITFVPPSSVATLDADELKRASGEPDPLRLVRSPERECFNYIAIRYIDRAKEYEPVIADYLDASDAEQRGIIRAPTVEVPWVLGASHARNLAQLLVKRSLRLRNVYSFRLGPRWGLVEPGDFVTVSDGMLLTSGVQCRVEGIDETEDGSLEVRAREWPAGTCALVAQSTEAVDPAAGENLPRSDLAGTSFIQVTSSGTIRNGSGSGTNTGNVASAAIVTGTPDVIRLTFTTDMPSATYSVELVQVFKVVLIGGAKLPLKHQVSAFDASVGSVDISVWDGAGDIDPLQSDSVGYDFCYYFRVWY